MVNIADLKADTRRLLSDSDINILNDFYVFIAVDSFDIETFDAIYKVQKKNGSYIQFFKQSMGYQDSVTSQYTRSLIEEHDITINVNDNNIKWSFPLID